MTSILPAHTRLTCPDPIHDFSVLSYNLMHPNSKVGWWVNKYYDPKVPHDHRTWAYRHRLIQDQIQQSEADIICLQELVPESFANDAAFLIELGYDFILHKKDQLRCATFWRKDRFSQSYSEIFCDRTLLTPLRSIHNKRDLWVINVHLKAGAEPARRLRQLHDVIERCEKAVQSLGRALSHTAVVIAGDFNADPENTAVAAYLQHGLVTPDFREPMYPDTVLSSRVRSQRLGPFVDTYQSAYPAAAIPATMLLPSRLSFFVDSGQNQLRDQVVGYLFELYSRFASSEQGMNHEDISRWIAEVNGAVNRGTEAEFAHQLLQKSDTQTLGFPDFVQVYVHLLSEGKIWSVWHDLYTTSARTVIEQWHEVFSARYDQIYASSNTLRVHAVREPLSPEQLHRVFTQGETLPNSWHPSDHVPVAAVLGWKPEKTSDQDTK